MFKFLSKVLLVSVLGFAAFGAQARDYVEGKDYEIRSQNRTREPEIREFFSFFCSHCFMMQDHFKKMAENFKGKAKFVYNPVGIIGGDIGVETQKLYAVAMNYGIEDEVKEDLFNHIHVNDERPDSHDYFVSLIEGHGVPSEEYENHYSSFLTQGKVSEWDRMTSELKINAVPEVVVNGKYLVVTDNLESIDDYNDLVDFLLTLP